MQQTHRSHVSTLVQLSILAASSRWYAVQTINGDVDKCYKTDSSCWRDPTNPLKTVQGDSCNLQATGQNL